MASLNSCSASGKGSGRPAAVDGIVVHRAVEQVRHAEPLPPGHRDVHAALKAAGVRLAGLDGRARKEDEVGDLAALQRELQNPLVLDHGADAGALHIHERRGGSHRHRLLEIPERRATILITGAAATWRTMPVCT